MGLSAKKSSKMKEVKTSGEVKEHTDPGAIKSKKRSGDEIDEIFSCKKKKKSKTTKVADGLHGKSIEKKKQNKVSTGHELSKPSNMNDRGKRVVKRSNKLPADGDLFGDSSKPRKNMSGLKIYTEEELGLNKSDAGGTPLCPFDCECCF